MEEKDPLVPGAPPEENAEPLGAQPVQDTPAPEAAPADAPPAVQKATRKQRVVALVAAAVVILITLAYTYSIYTGALFSR